MWVDRHVGAATMVARAAAAVVGVVLVGVLVGCHAPDRRGAETPTPATSSRPPTTGSSSPVPVDRIGWSVDLGDSTEAAPAFAAGVVFVHTHHGALAALDARSGAVRWRVELDGLGGSLAVAEGQLYVVSGDANMSQCRLRAFDAASGTHRWARTSRPCSALTVGAGVAYLTVGGVVHSTGRVVEPARVVALEADTGRQRWSVRIDSADATLSAPVVAGRMVYFTGSAELVALDTASGRVRWRTRFDRAGGQVSQPLIDGGLVHVVRQWGHGQSAVYAVDARTGQRLWVSQVRGLAAFRAPLFAANTVVVVSDDGRVRGLNHRTGRLRWVRALGSTDRGGPPARAVSAGNTVYVSLAGRLHALDATTGRTVWTDPNPPPGDPLGADNGMAYLGAASGVISAVGRP
jgi:outer membrane protein assembly factor BamB